MTNNIIMIANNYWNILLFSSIILFLTTLYCSTIFQGYPLNQLGIRSKGKGLLSYLYNGFISGIGVYGYDPILGSLSPTFRVSIHISFILLLWAISGIIYDYFIILNNVNDNYNIVNTLGIERFIKVGIVVFFIYISIFSIILYTILPGVSVPDQKPRKHKIQRYPQWDNKYISISKILINKFRFVISQDSHQISEKLFAGTSGCITGEPYGRDIWTNEILQHDSNIKLKDILKVNEKIIQDMASGGRSVIGFNPSINPNSCDTILREQLIRNYVARGNTLPSITTIINSKTSTKTNKSVKDSLKQAVHFYSMLLTDDGHWSGDYGGPHFLLPGLIIVWYIMNKPNHILNNDSIELIKHYMFIHQQIDGGWGTHIESPSTMFGTVMQYVSLRLLGVQLNDPICIKAKKFIHDNGGAIMTASWAKFYLCLLGCMEWDGHNSVPPEMWLLPNWLPFHPSRMWCHARMVYLPMGYLYGIRYIYDKAETDDIILSLRKELYCENYNTIQWINTRHYVAPMDNYSPIPLIMKILQNILARYETWSFIQPFKNIIRKRGLDFCIKYMEAEDLQTNFINIGPVNKVLNMLSAYQVANNDINHPNVVNHMMRIADYMWVAEDGMKMKGYNGSQCWDTSFAIQAIYESNLLDEFPIISQKVWGYLERCQILSTNISKATSAYQYESAIYRKMFYRHISEGGWPFSTSAHGWPISDCTGEGLKGVLCLLKSKTIQDGLDKKILLPIGEERLQKAVNVIISYQNEDGGFATYENNRGFGWYESLNPSEVFGDIMIDYSYVECSMASLTALVDFHEEYPTYRSDEVLHSIDKGREFLKSIQRKDGSWYGNWACCFCYGCWFGIEGLVKCGESLTSKNITKACTFLLSHQRSNGGWGEDFTSCYDKDYAKNGMEAYGDGGSGVVNTGWALLALSAAKCQDIEAIKRGVKYLLERQLPCGDWPQEGIAGVFNRACGITYTAYRNVFPIWALGRCRSVYGDVLDE